MFIAWTEWTLVIMNRCFSFLFRLSEIPGPLSPCRSIDDPLLGRFPLAVARITHCLVALFCRISLAFMGGPLLQHHSMSSVFILFLFNFSNLHYPLYALFHPSPLHRT